MSSIFYSLKDQDQAHIASQINKQGFACLHDFLNSIQLHQLREQVQEQARRHKGEYFAYHGGEEVADSLLSVLGPRRNSRSCWPMSTAPAPGEPHTAIAFTW